MDTYAAKKHITVTGTIVRGVGQSASFLCLAWVDRQIVEKLGFSPYPGTLNIDVRDPNVQKEMKGAGSEKLRPEEAGFCDALICGGLIAGKHRCGVVLPLVPGYPETILEIVAPVNLKEALQVEDGDAVAVELFL